MTDLTHLYLEEETLTAAAFHFATNLPRLERLGLQDVQISDAEVRRLRNYAQRQHRLNEPRAETVPIADRYLRRASPRTRI